MHNLLLSYINSVLTVKSNKSLVTSENCSLETCSKIKTYNCEYSSYDVPVTFADLQADQTLNINESSTIRSCDLKCKSVVSSNKLPLTSSALSLLTALHSVFN